MSERIRLPGRRQQITDNFCWPPDTGARIHISAGFDTDGRFLETFMRGGGRVGSDTDGLLDDVAILLSRLLQHGETLKSISASLGRAHGGPVSVISAAVDRLREMGGDA